MILTERLRIMGPYTILALVVVGAAATSPIFFRTSNLQTVGRHAAFLSVVALGQLLVVIGRGLDLSVGAVITTTSLLMIQIAGVAGGNPVAGVTAVAAAAVGIGLLNGTMVAFRRVPAILATLATFVLVQGTALWLTEGRSRGRIPELLLPLGAGRVGPVPVPVLVAGTLAVLVAFVLRRSTYGRSLYATGLNPEASALAGVPTRSLIASTFVVCSLFAAIAGLMLSGYVGFYDRTLGVGYDLDSIAAVVLGGASLAGGRGYVTGTLAAALGLAALDNLLLIQGVGEPYKLIGKGLVLFMAVLFAVFLNRQPGAASPEPAANAETTEVDKPPERNEIRP